MFEAMLQGEMDRHLGYETNDRGAKSTTNRRNGYTEKTVKSSMGEIEIHTPRDRDGSFEPHLIPKRAKDVSGIEDKVLSMYAKGMSQRDIAGTIEEIYGFEISHETISAITDRVIETAREWQNRPLKKFYTFLFVDCLYVNIRKDLETKGCAVYVILGYDVDGIKDVLWVVNKMRAHYAQAKYVVGDTFAVTESKTLGLDITKSLGALDWAPLLSCDKMLYNVVDFFKRQQAGVPEAEICAGQIQEFFQIDQ